jgi:predicted nucleic acid-binding protein
VVAGGPLYLDASALVKLVLEERETAALRRFLAAGDQPQVTSLVAAVEVSRAAKRSPDVEPLLFQRVLSAVSYLRLDDAIAHRAADIQPSGLRSLDAIHLASALALGPELEAFVTYDGRLADVARVHGLPVVAPA